MPTPLPRQTLESRVQLFSALSEAAELEHNLLCLYLYAASSLKRTEEEGVTARQLEVIARWRRVILGVALEEMNHLTLVSNIMVATGGSPHLMRPNFPVSPGLYPAALVIELAPFELSTVEHFVYLERPAAREVEDGATFPHRENYVREAPVGRLMPHAGDYATVGDLYRDIRHSIETLCESIGEERFFSRETARQIGPLDSQLPGLTLVTDRESAVRALDTIVTQGEGALTEEGSHFARFQAIAVEYQELLKSDPTFVPGRPVARNPVMRRPPTREGRVWIQNPLAVRYVDLADALYSFMLRVLVQVHTVEGRAPPSKRALLETSLDAMHAMGSVAEALTYLSANDDTPAIRAGLSFAMVRTLAPLDSQAESALLAERLLQIAKGFDELQSELQPDSDAGAPPPECTERLGRARVLVVGCRQRILAAPFGSISQEPPPVPSPAPLPAAELAGVDVARGKSLSVSFDAKRCIHSRYCVTELPRVFQANTPGTWLFPDEAEAELLAAVIRECPSGALQYGRLDDRPPEPLPEVNLIHVQENGPYAVLADMDLGGRNVGYRATLCRCGQSKNKPLCDGSHTAAQFKATGAPATLDATALSERGGRLRIDPTPNGPLALTGNVELCAGTGRIVLRTVAARLCRCGHSNTRPLCDGSHVAAGFVSEEPATTIRVNAARPGG